MTFRMVRNTAIEKYLLGRVEPFAPRFDVEEIDDLGLPLRVIGFGLGAEAARELIAKTINQPGETSACSKVREAAHSTKNVK